MNADEYIASGKLKDYCLGLLSEEEKKTAEEMCHLFPEVARELQLLHKAIENYAGSNTAWRKEELRKSVWEAIKKSDGENG